MTGGSLYTGRAGGFDLAAEWAGIKVLWQVEKDKKAHKFLNKNFPNSQKFFDAKDCGKHNLTNVDIIFGGFPCQPFSIAGKQKGTADNRCEWPNFKRIIADLRPTWVVAENVDGITQLYESSGNIYLEDQTSITKEVYSVLERIRRDFEQLEYESEFYIIPASAVGALHRRYRIFIVAYTGSDFRKKSMAGGIEKTISQQPIIYGHERQINDVANTNGEQSAKLYINTSDQAEKIKRAQRIKDGKRLRDSFIDSRKIIPNTNGRGWQKPQIISEKQIKESGRIFTRSYWKIEPPVGRVVNGFPGRVAELEGLGLAVVPQVAYLFFKPIVEISKKLL